MRHTPPYSQKVAGPPATVHEYDTWNTHSLFYTNGHGEVHEDLAGDEAEDEAGADVDGVGDGSHPRRQHLGHHDPDQRAVAAVTQEQEDHWG